MTSFRLPHAAPIATDAAVVIWGISFAARAATTDELAEYLVKCVAFQLLIDGKVNVEGPVGQLPILGGLFEAQPRELKTPIRAASGTRLEARFHALHSAGLEHGAALDRIALVLHCNDER